MPGVPWVRPSHGSVQNAANGMQPQSRRASAAACTSSPTSQWPVCRPSAIGDPSGARTPPCVLRIMNAGRVVSSGRQPMATLWVSPNRLPLGSSRSISAVIGSAPSGAVPMVRSP